MSKTATIARKILNSDREIRLRTVLKKDNFEVVISDYTGKKSVHAAHAITLGELNSFAGDLDNMLADILTSLTDKMDHINQENELFGAGGDV